MNGEWKMENEFIGEMTGEGTGNRELGTGSAAAALSVEIIGNTGRQRLFLFPVPRSAASPLG